MAAGALEDLGWFVIDNLPADLVPKVGELASSATGGYDRVALVMGGHGVPQEQIAALRGQVGSVTVVYLEATTDVLVRRFESTRRRHQMAEGRTLIDAIEYERTLLQPVRAAADLVIDTSDLNPHQLRELMTGHFQDDDEHGQLRIMVSSFGFKHGLPLDADLVFDCRFLPNPYWVEELRPRTGLDPEIQRYVLDRELTEHFLGHLAAMLGELLPAYAAEGKSYLSIAFGCTGGRHRSVAVAERVNELLGERGWRSRASHRDINREGN